MQQRYIHVKSPRLALWLTWKTQKNLVIAHCTDVHWKMCSCYTDSLSCCCWYNKEGQLHQLTRIRRHQDTAALLGYCVEERARDDIEDDHQTTCAGDDEDNDLAFTICSSCRRARSFCHSGTATIGRWGLERRFPWWGWTNSFIWWTLSKSCLWWGLDTSFPWWGDIVWGFPDFFFSWSC